MKILANENVPFEAILALRKEGHDVGWIAEKNKGILDRDVIHLALSEQRILLTFDKDFGELVYHQGTKASPGIILLRLVPKTPKWIGQFLCNLLKRKMKRQGHFAVVTENNIRLLPLPRF